MKHETLWTFVLWIVTLCIFELPLLSFPIGEIIGTNNRAFIVLIDIYAIVSLFALCIAKYGIKTINNIIANLKSTN